jgi:phosphate transport system ATP-binding protein
MLPPPDFIFQFMAYSLPNETSTDSTAPAVEIRELCFAYAGKPALQNVSLDIPNREITAFIGPSGCGKSTLLRCLNRINDRIPGAAVTGGSIRIHGIDINRRDIDLQELRRRVGMVFQKYNPFPKSIYENVVFSLRGERPPAPQRARAFRRPAAAAVHRPGDRQPAGHPADGRAVCRA